MDWSWLLLLLPVAFLSGWLLAQKNKIKTRDEQPNQLSAEYFKGLNYLLSDEQDKALPIFLNLVQVDNQTVDTHLALASIYRRNGEIEKSISVHQNLIARPSLPAGYRSRALLELGRDYLAAGLFDRAEGLFSDVIKTGEYNREARLHMMTIFQQEKEWQQAVKVAKALIIEGDVSLRPLIAQFYCEISDEYFRQGNIKQADLHAKQAVNYDPSCIRAYIILARLAKTSKKYKLAIKYLRQIEEKDIDFFPAVFEEFIECYREQGNLNELVEYLVHIDNKHPSVILMDVLVKLLSEIHGNDAAKAYLNQRLHITPDLSALNALITLQSQIDPSQCEFVLNDMQHIIANLAQYSPTYQCRQCGYTAGTLYWQCPSCHEWGKIKPVTGQLNAKN